MGGQCAPPAGAVLSAINKRDREALIIWIAESHLSAPKTLQVVKNTEHCRTGAGHCRHACSKSFQTADNLTDARMPGGHYGLKVIYRGSLTASPYFSLETIQFIL